jgi:DNA polymerase III gamma/tau subunit
METVTRNLSASMRPRRFSEVLGHENLLQQLRDQFSKTIPLLIMLVGSPGAGKTTLAHIIAASVQEEGGIFGEPTDETLADYDSHTFDCTEMNAALLNKVDDARELVPQLMVYPRYGRFKTFIFNEAQQWTEAAQNVFLAPFEDARSTNLFIISTTDPSKFIDAIKSRAKVFVVPDLSYEAMFQLTLRTTAQLNPGAVDEDRAKQLTDALWQSDVKAGRAIVQAAERLFSGASSSIEDAINVQQTGTIDFSTVIDGTMQGDWMKIRGILAKAQSSDIDQLRARLLYRLSSYLTKNEVGDTTDRLASFIHEIARHNSYEKGVQLRATIASIYTICRTIQKNKKK